jgi:alpha-beta hydrolase superfamily lysophospholipase
MNLLSEFRHPTTWYSKLVAAVMALGFFVLLATAVAGSYLVYHIVAPIKTGESVDLTNLPGRPEDFSYDVAGLGARAGWFFPGLKSAPTILLCPGYAAGREELLPLATGLQDHGYNVLLFDFASRGLHATYSTLGFREVRELRAAISAIAARPDVDRSRFGLWGTNVGAYAAVAAAEADPRVQALVVESLYDRPEDMLSLLLSRYGVSPLPFFRPLAEDSFLWFNYRYRQTPPLSAGATRLGSDRKLFLEATDEPSLVGPTHELFLLAPQPKEEVLLTQGNYEGMLDDEKRTYENRIISFFLLNLPP